MPRRGFPLAVCPQGSYGKVAATQPKAGTVGAFVELDLTKYYQSASIVAPQAVSPPPKGGAPAFKGTGRFKLGARGSV